MNIFTLLLTASVFLFPCAVFAAGLPVPASTFQASFREWKADKTFGSYSKLCEQGLAATAAQAAYERDALWTLAASLDSIQHDLQPLKKGIASSVYNQYLAAVRVAYASSDSPETLRNLVDKACMAPYWAQHSPKEWGRREVANRKALAQIASTFQPKPTPAERVLTYCTTVGTVALRATELRNDGMLLTDQLRSIGTDHHSYRLLASILQDIYTYRVSWTPDRARQEAELACFKTF